MYNDLWWLIVSSGYLSTPIYLGLVYLCIYVTLFLFFFLSFCLIILDWPSGWLFRILPLKAMQLVPPMGVEVKGVVVRRDWQWATQCLHTGVHNRTVIITSFITKEHQTPLKITKTNLYIQTIRPCWKAHFVIMTIKIKTLIPGLGWDCDLCKMFFVVVIFWAIADV